MELYATCPKCGKNLGYEDKEAGLVTICPACGTTFNLPLPLALASDVPPQLPAKIEAEEPPPPDFIEVRTPGNRLLPLVILVASLAFIEAMILLWIGLHPKASWEQMNRQHILDLKTEAESLAERGRTQEAYDRFCELQKVVAGNPIQDPELLSAVAVAEDEQSDAARRLAQQSSQTVVNAQPAPTTQPIVVVQAPPPAPPTQPSIAQIASSRRPHVHEIPPPPPGVGAHGVPLVDDARIGVTIENGIKYLTDRFQQSPDGTLRINNSTGYSNGGVDALCVYALLQAYDATGDSSLDPHRAFMKAALDTLKTFSLDDGQATYSHSLRANALQLGGRDEDRAALANDLHWLLRAGLTGAYTYVQRPASPTGTTDDTVWDNSNTQYGLLGVWAAAEAGLPVPDYYWKTAHDHWVQTQHDDGRWGYTAGDSDGTRSMTLAGIASLFVTEDYLNEYRQANGVGQAPFDPSLTKALAWLESSDNGVVPFNWGYWPGYALYGLERVGLASGLKYFGTHDWYRESAADVVNSAGADGGWGNEINTSFALLFLARGRHPVLMNKLRFDGNWANRPRDAANLAHYASHTLEQQINWQVVPIDHDWTDWTDSSILYLASESPPNLTSDDEQKIKQYILNGGLLLTQADGGSQAFDLWSQQLGQRLFPQYHWSDLPADHPLWTVGLHIKNRPRALALTNGARILMVELPQDLSSVWQAQSFSQNPDAYSFGLNLFLYASGRTELRNRLVTTAISDAPGDPQATIKMAELEATGGDDPEPAAWPRFVKWFRWQTDLGIHLVPTPMQNLNPDSPPIAHLTGVKALKATDLECDSFASYVKAGGIVLIDPCGGPNDFLRSVRQDLLIRAFGPDAANPTHLDDQSNLLIASDDGMSQLWPAEIRDWVREQPSPLDRGIYILREGKGAVVIASLDVTSGLLGSNTWGIAGYTPDYCLNFAKNFVLWAWDGAPQ